MTGTFSNYHCPRWEELPTLALYMDQVLIVIQEAVGSLMPEDGSTATATMINNYVKMKAIPPTEKKKYNREHIARLIMITILKRVLSVSEIIFVMEQINGPEGFGKGYNDFCQKLEEGLCGWQNKEGRTAEELTVLSAAVYALAGKLAFEDEMRRIKGSDIKDSGEVGDK